MKATLYRNAKIFTSDPAALHADAMLVEDGQIAWIGNEEKAPSGEFDTVDLQRKRVLPGFIDSHQHPILLSEFSREISVLPPNIHSIKELQDEIRRVREEQGPGKWILGWGYDEGKLEEKRSPNRYDLDQACSDSPISLLRTCAHIRAVNSKALELAGIDRNTPDPEGGEIDRDEKGEPTGILKENARNPISRIMPQRSDEQTVVDIVDLGKLLASQGIVGVADMSPLGPKDYYPHVLEASKRGFKQKIGMFVMWDYVKDDPDFDIPEERLDPNNQVKVNGIKLIGDGSVSGKTAWMTRPYLGTKDTYGMPVATEEDIEGALACCKKRGVQLAMHAMGGRTIERIVNRVYKEEPWAKYGTSSLRVEHVTDPTDDSIKKVAEKGIAFSSQPIFMYAEIESYLANLGEEWMKTCYPFKKLLDAGVDLSFSTDAPATSWAVASDPFPCLKGAVTRKAYDGTDCGQDQKVDIETAIQLYTREGAKLMGFPKSGMLKEGYDADFIVLDKDIMTIPSEEIDTVSVLETYIGGDQVYKA